MPTICRDLNLDFFFQLSVGMGCFSGDRQCVNCYGVPKNNTILLLFILSAGFIVTKREKKCLFCHSINLVLVLCFFPMHFCCDCLSYLDFSVSSHSGLLFAHHQLIYCCLSEGQDEYEKDGFIVDDADEEEADEDVERAESDDERQKKKKRKKK